MKRCGRSNLSQASRARLLAMAQYCYNCKGLVVPTERMHCPKCGQDLGRRPEIDLHSAHRMNRPPITNYTIGFWDDIPPSSRGDDCGALLDPRKLVRSGWIDSDELVPRCADPMDSDLIVCWDCYRATHRLESDADGLMDPADVAQWDAARDVRMDRWAQRYDDLNGAPEGEEDR